MSTQRALKKHSESNQTLSYHQSLNYFVLFSLISHITPPTWKVLKSCNLGFMVSGLGSSLDPFFISACPQLSTYHFYHFTESASYKYYSKARIFWILSGEYANPVQGRSSKLTFYLSLYPSCSVSLSLFYRNRANHDAIRYKLGKTTWDCLRIEEPRTFLSSSSIQGSYHLIDSKVPKFGLKL